MVSDSVPLCISALRAGGLESRHRNKQFLEFEVGSFNFYLWPSDSHGVPPGRPWMKSPARISFLVALGVALVVATTARAQSNADCLGCHDDPTLNAVRDGRRVSRHVDVKALRPLSARRRGMRLVPCGSRRQRLPAQGAGRPGRLRRLPRRGRRPVRAEPAREQGRRGGQAGATLPGLPRLARYPAPHRPRLARDQVQHSLHVRLLPQGGNAGLAFLQYPAGQHPDALLGKHPRRGAFPEGPHDHRGLHGLSHRPLRPPTHRQPLQHRARERGRDLPEVPRPHRTGAREGHPGRIVGKGAQTGAGLRGLPPAAQGAPHLLRRGDFRPRLPRLPFPAGPRHQARRQTGFPDGVGRRTARLDPPQRAVRAVPRRRHALAQAPVRHRGHEGGLLDLPRRAGQTVPGRHPWPAGRARRCRCSPLHDLPRHPRHESAP